MKKLSKTTLIKNMVKRHPYLSYQEASNIIEEYWRDIQIGLEDGYAISWNNIGTLYIATKPKREKYDINKQKIVTFPETKTLKFTTSRNWNKGDK